MRANPEQLLGLLREERACCAGVLGLIEQQQGFIRACLWEKVLLVSHQVAIHFDQAPEIRLRRARLQRQIAREHEVPPDALLPEALSKLPPEFRAKAGVLVGETDDVLQQIQGWLRRNEQAIARAFTVSEKMIRALKPTF